MTKTKLAAVALAALTLGTTALMSAADAKPWGYHHHHHHGWGWGGVGLGLATGAYFASQPDYVYVDGPRCRWVRQFDDFGRFVGKAKVCRY